MSLPGSTSAATQAQRSGHLTPRLVKRCCSAPPATRSSTPLPTALWATDELCRRVSAGSGAFDGWPSTSDNRIVSEISATDASKRFADMLDAVEHRGETFTVVRRGRAIATVAPARRTTLGALREFIDSHPADDGWERDLAELRGFVGSAPTSDPWTD